MASDRPVGPFQLPADALIDEALLAQIARYPSALSLAGLHQLLDGCATARTYDPARLLAQECFLSNLTTLPTALEHWRLHAFIERHLDPHGRERAAQHFLRGADPGLRRWAAAYFAAADIHWPASWTRHRDAARRSADVPARPSLPRLETVADVRVLLGISSTAQLGWMLLGGEQGAEQGPYVCFTIPKSSGGRRQICAPRPRLKQVQRQLLHQILSRVPVHPAAHGFVPGRSTVTNAAAHVGRAIIVKFDLKDFFPSVSYGRVLGVYAQLGYPLGELRPRSADTSGGVAPVLARLSVYAPAPRSYGTGTLPQGAPTSPALGNLVCRHLDARLSALATTLRGTYTRYADDLTLSFSEEPPVGRLRWLVEEICRQEGFRVHRKKFRVIRRSQRQRVTGVVVNDALRVPRPARRRFRAILHNCRRHGVASQARGRPDFPSYLRGFASYVHMVHPEEGRRLLDEVEAILSAEPPA